MVMRIYKINSQLGYNIYSVSRIVTLFLLSFPTHLNASDFDFQLATIESKLNTQLNIYSELAVGANKLKKLCNKPKKDKPLTVNLESLSKVKKLIQDRKTIVAAYNRKLASTAKEILSNAKINTQISCKTASNAPDTVNQINKQNPMPCELAETQVSASNVLVDNIQKLTKVSNEQHKALLLVADLEGAGCLDPGFTQSMTDKFIFYQTDQDGSTQDLLQEILRQTNVKPNQ